MEFVFDFNNLLGTWKVSNTIHLLIQLNLYMMAYSDQSYGNTYFEWRNFESLITKSIRIWVTNIRIVVWECSFLFVSITVNKAIELAMGLGRKQVHQLDGHVSFYWQLKHKSKHHLLMSLCACCMTLINR